MLNEVDIQDLIKRLKIYKEAHRVAVEGLTMLSENNTVAKVVLEEMQKSVTKLSRLYYIMMATHEGFCIPFFPSLGYIPWVASLSYEATEENKY